MLLFTMTILTMARPVTSRRPGAPAACCYTPYGCTHYGPIYYGYTHYAARSVCRTLHVTGKGGMQAAELAEIFRAAGWRQVDCVSV